MKSPLIAFAVSILPAVHAPAQSTIDPTKPYVWGSNIGWLNFGGTPAAPVVENPAIGPADALTSGGAPQPTMKTLHPVEPRIPNSTLPFTMSESGSDDFTRNLHFTAATGNAVTVERCHARNNLGDGFIVIASVANDCTAVNNMPLGGFYTTEFPGGQFTGCVTTFNAAGGFGAVSADLSHCTASLNETGIGTQGSSVSHCTSFGNIRPGIGARGRTAMHCKVIKNSGIGITADGGSVSQCVASENAQYGIYAKTGVNAQCAASGNNTSSTSPFNDIFPPSPQATLAGNFPTP